MAGSTFKIKPCKECGSSFHQAWQCPVRMKKKLQDSKTTTTIKKSSPASSGESRGSIIDKLDVTFAQYIKEKQRQENYGQNFCFICQKKLTKENTFAMHFINRRFVAVRFDEDNVKPGCWECNNIKHGNLEEYEKQLGEDVVFEINLRKQNKVYTYQLKELLKEYKGKLKYLQKMV